MRKVKIEVTEKDIRNGVCADTERCAVTKAIKRAIPKTWVSVDDMIIEVGQQRIDTPAKVAKFVGAYDRLAIDKKPPRGTKLVGKLKPFSFVLKIPEEG